MPGICAGKANLRLIRLLVLRQNKYLLTPHDCNFRLGHVFNLTSPFFGLSLISAARYLFRLYTCFRIRLLQNKFSTAEICLKIATTPSLSPPHSTPNHSFLLYFFLLFCIFLYSFSSCRLQNELLCHTSWNISIKKASKETRKKKNLMLLKICISKNFFGLAVNISAAKFAKFAKFRHRRIFLKRWKRFEISKYFWLGIKLFKENLSEVLKWEFSLGICIANASELFVFVTKPRVQKEICTPIPSNVRRINFYMKKWESNIETLYNTWKFNNAS